VNAPRKLILGIGAGVVLVVLLLLSVLVIAPKLIAVEAVQDKIRNALSDRLGVGLAFERLAVAFFPVPRFDVDQTTFKLPAGSEGTVAEMTVYPEILPLLLGELKLKELRIQRPALAVTLAGSREPEPLRARLSAMGARLQEFAATFEALPAITDGRIDAGHLELHDGKGRLFALRNVQASLKSVSGKAQFEASAVSDLAESLSLVGWIDSKQQRSRVQIRVAHAQLRGIDAFFAPNAPVRIKEGVAELGIELVRDGPGQLSADIEVDAPRVELAHENEIVGIKGGILEGSVAVDSTSVTVSVSELAAEQPKLRVSSGLISTLGGGRMRLALQGMDIDVRAVREAARALAKHSQLSRGLFDVLKTGVFPSITLHTEGFSLGDLGNLDNVSVQGQLRDAELTIPEVPLEVVDTSVDFSLSDRALEGQNLQARLGKSSLRKGHLTLNLLGADKPFQLQAAFRADLSELPPLLMHSRQAPALQKGLAQLEPLNGQASGTLVLSKDSSTAKVEVEASNLELSAEAPGMPSPLRITGGSVRYDNKRFNFTQLTGSLGSSPFSALTGVLQLHEEPDLEILSAKGRLYLAEIVPWLSSRHWMPEALKYYAGEGGTITVSSVHLKGPVDRPQAAHFSVSGQVEDLVLEHLPEHPGPLTIRSANFQATPETLRYRDGRLRLQDAELTLSAIHQHYLEGLDKDVTLAVEGDFGPQAIQWASKVLGVPPWLKPRPLTLSSSTMTYRKNSVETFSAALHLDNGVEISTALNRTPGELIIKKLSIRDKRSRATIGLYWKPKKIDVSFSGKLYRQTLDRLLVENRLLDGWIDGDLQASIATPSLANSRVNGTLRGRGLLGRWDARLPFRINAFVLSGNTHRLFVDWVDLTLAEMPLTVSGNIDLASQARPQLEMSVRADRLNLDHLVQALRARADTTGAPADKTFARLPVQGQVRLQTERFVFNDLTWAPVRANIRIGQDTIEVTVRDAVLCGIATPGTLRLSSDSVRFDLKLRAEDQALESALSCVAGERLKADGTYRLRGQIQGRGNAQNLLNNASGNLELTAKDGRIYHDIVLLKVLKFLNASELFTGRAKLEDVRTKGLRYRSAKVTATLREGTVRYEQGLLDANPMVVVAAGEHNLLNKNLRLDLLVAPLVPLDRLLEDIPVVGGILGTLDAVPLTVTGQYDDLVVRPLTPSAVGYQLQELLRNTVRVPIRLIGHREARRTKSNAVP
jgi:hypothetical protein